MVDKLTLAAIQPAQIPSRAGGAIAARPAGASFADMLQKLGNDALATGNQSEAVSVQAAARQAELVDVVTAVTSAEVTLQAVIAVRDRLIQAYQEIVKMPI